MTSSGPSPTAPDHRDLQAPTKRLTQTRQARDVALALLGAATFAGLVCLVLAIQLRAWQPAVIAASILPYGAAVVFGLRLFRQNHFETGTWIIVSGLSFLCLIVTGLVEAIGFILGPLLVMLVLLVTSQTLPWKQARRAVLASIIIGLAISVLDQIKLPFRLSFPGLTIFTVMLAAIIGFLACGFLMVRQFRYYALRAKLIVVLLAASVISATTVSLVLILNTRQVLIDKANQTLFAAATSTADRLDNFVQGSVEAIQVEAKLPGLIDFLTLPAAQQLNSAQSERAMNELRALLASKVQLYIRSYALLDRSGRNVADTNPDDIGTDESKRDYFLDPMQDEQTYISPVEFEETNESTLYFSTPVRNDREEVIGLLRVRYKAVILQHWIALNNEQAGLQSFAALLDENHILLAHGLKLELVAQSIMPLQSARAAQLQSLHRLPKLPLDSLALNLPDLEAGLDHATSQPFFEAALTPFDDRPSSAAVVPMKTRPAWSVVFFQPQAVFLAPVEDQTRATTLLACVMACVITGAALVLSQRIMRPIARLTAVARKVAAGDLRVRARVESNDEIGVLATTFNSMTGRLQTLIQSLEQQVARLTSTQTALRESEDRFRTIFEAVNDAVLVYDLATCRILDVNHKTCEMYGYTRSEICQLNTQDLSSGAPPYTHAEALGWMQKAAGGEPQIFEWRAKAKDGRLFWVEENIRRATIGGQERLLVAARDITERKMARENVIEREQALRRQNEYLSALHATTLALIDRLDLSDLLEAIVGRAGLLLGMPHGFIDLIMPDAGYAEVRVGVGIYNQLAGYRTPINEGVSGRVWQTGQPFRIEDYDVWPERPLNFPTGLLHTLVGVPLKSGSQVIGVLGLAHAEAGLTINDEQVDLLSRFAELASIALDNARLYTAAQHELQERQRVEAELRLSEEKFYKAFHSTPVMMTIENSEDQFIDVNKAFVETLGYSRAEVIGQRVSELPIWESSEDRERIKRAFGSQDTLKDLELRFRHKLGQTGVILMSAEKIELNGRAHILTAMLDITERKRAEAEREALIQELENKNAELERFAYTVSHDLKSPLITIRGFLGFLEEDARAGRLDRLKADIARIENATSKMQLLLNDLLDLSRVGRLINPPEEVSLQVLVREALALVAGRIAGRKVQIEIAPGLSTVYGDHARLLEVMQNLLDNAVKFMGDQPQPRVEIGQRAAETGLPVYYVRDNGIGIERRYHQKVFGLFDKLEVNSEGTGVGLALVKRIIEVHGGHVWIESAGSGTGTTVCFTLPAPPLIPTQQESQDAQ